MALLGLGVGIVVDVVYTTLTEKIEYKGKSLVEHTKDFARGFINNLFNQN
jgi:hypothetical protein